MSMLLKRISNIERAAVGSIYRQHRHLSLQEHISHSILNEHGIETPRFSVAKTAGEAEKAARDLLTKNLIVKAQVLAGGRKLGKFCNGFKGGVHSATSPEEVKEIACKMINKKLMTKQTGPKGKICHSVMVAERKFPRREFYFAFALEREFNGAVLIASRYGGVNIEDVAADSPCAIIYEPINMDKGFTKEMAEWIARRVGIVDQAAPTVKMLCGLYSLFIKKDTLLAEINPYIEDVCLNYYALDAKLTFDESAKFRQTEIFAQRDTSQEDEKEVVARNLGMSYIALDGSIGCMVNGAGLAMATLDILKFHGGNPANFLDVGSMANADAVKEAVRVILMDPKVRTIFVNVYGGMMRCDIIVEGLLKAIRELNIKIPIVARLQGNMHKSAQKMIRQANTNIITREDFGEAAEMAVRCSKIINLADEGALDANLKMKMICECERIEEEKPKQKYPPCPPKKKVAKDGLIGMPKHTMKVVKEATKVQGITTVPTQNTTKAAFKIMPKDAHKAPLKEVSKAKDSSKEPSKEQVKKVSSTAATQKAPTSIKTPSKDAPKESPSPGGVIVIPRPKSR